MSLRVIKIVNNPVPSNCYLMFDRAVGCKCIIIDPGSQDTTAIEAMMKYENVSPEFIILSHEHFDHCWGVNSLRKSHSLKLICSKLCSDAIQSDKKNLSIFYNQIGFKVKAADYFSENYPVGLDWAGHCVKFIRTPGHTESSISLIIDHKIFTGDAFIKDQRTVTKLPTGSIVSQKETDILFRSMFGKHYLIFPGHGDIFELDNFIFDRYD